MASRKAVGKVEERGQMHVTQPQKCVYANLSVNGTPGSDYTIKIQCKTILSEVRQINIHEACS